MRTVADDIEIERLKVRGIVDAIKTLRVRGVVPALNGMRGGVVNVKRTGAKTFKAVLEDAVKSSFKR
jgi:hypothetical protein